MIKKIFFLISIIVITLILWYHIPSNINRTIALCSLDGKCITVKFDVSWHKYILKPTELRGKFSVDNRIYQTKSKDSSGFFEKINLKINNQKYIPAFMRESDTDYIVNDLALLFVSDLNLDKICLNIKDEDNHYINYYGPARTAKEAKLLSENIFNEAINY